MKARSIRRKQGNQPLTERWALRCLLEVLSLRCLTTETCRHEKQVQVLYTKATTTATAKIIIRKVLPSNNHILKQKIHRLSKQNHMEPAIKRQANLLNNLLLVNLIRHPL